MADNFTTYLKWGERVNAVKRNLGCTSAGRYGSPRGSLAFTHFDAARTRLDTLNQPTEYGGIVVVGNGEVVVFDIVVPDPQPDYELVQR